MKEYIILFPLHIGNEMSIGNTRGHFKADHVAVIDGALVLSTITKQAEIVPVLILAPGQWLACWAPEE